MFWTFFLPSLHSVYGYRIVSLHGYVTFFVIGTLDSLGSLFGLDKLGSLHICRGKELHDNMKKKENYI